MPSSISKVRSPVRGTKNNPVVEGYFYGLPVLDRFRSANWRKIKRDIEENSILSMFPNLALQN